jgi:hypothetical protein
MARTAAWITHVRATAERTSLDAGHVPTSAWFDRPHADRAATAELAPAAVLVNGALIAGRLTSELSPDAAAIVAKGGAQESGGAITVDGAVGLVASPGNPIADADSSGLTFRIVDATGDARIYASAEASYVMTAIRMRTERRTVVIGAAVVKGIRSLGRGVIRPRQGGQTTALPDPMDQPTIALFVTAFAVERHRLYAPTVRKETDWAEAGSRPRPHRSGRRAGRHRSARSRRELGSRRMRATGRPPWSVHSRGNGSRAVPDPAESGARCHVDGTVEGRDASSGIAAEDAAPSGAGENAVPRTGSPALRIHTSKSPSARSAMAS